MRDDELRAELIDFARWILTDESGLGLHETIVDSYIAEAKARGEW